MSMNLLKWGSVMNLGTQSAVGRVGESLSMGQKAMESTRKEQQAGMDRWQVGRITSVGGHGPQQDFRSAKYWLGGVYSN